jgi:hypothetical protein
MGCWGPTRAAWPKILYWNVVQVVSVPLDTHLSSLAEKEGCRAEGQAGFWLVKCTVDHVYLLRHLNGGSE